MTPHQQAARTVERLLPYVTLRGADRARAEHLAERFTLAALVLIRRDAPRPADRCAVCERALAPVLHGRPRVTCSDACRQALYRRRRA